MQEENSLTVVTLVTLNVLTFAPERYGLAVVGNCMAPAYLDGCNVESSKTLPYERGDVSLSGGGPSY